MYIFRLFSASAMFTAGPHIQIYRNRDDNHQYEQVHWYATISPQFHHTWYIYYTHENILGKIEYPISIIKNRMELPLEIFHTIFAHCNPETVFAIANTCHVLTALAGETFKGEKALIEHKKAFNPTVKLLNTRYDIYTNIIPHHASHLDWSDSISIRYTPMSPSGRSRKIGYRFHPSALRFDTDLRTRQFIDVVTIIVSESPRLTADWKIHIGEHNSIEYRSVNYSRVYAYDGDVSVDPEENKSYGRSFDDFEYITRIELY
jgi:hypothetical protein